jgi:predicted nucleic acid-binding protein
MGGIVSNATSLIYLNKIGRIGLLRNLFGDVFIPEEVKVEVVERGKQLGEVDAYVVEKAVNDGWLKVSRAEVVEVPIELDKGEVAALSLAKNMGLGEVLMDEAPARTAARLLVLTPRGTIFVLLKALENGEMDLDLFLESLNELIRHGFRLKEEVYIEVVRRAREIEAEN